MSLEIYYNMNPNIKVKNLSIPSHKATPVTRRLRRGMGAGALKRAARKPFKKVLKLPEGSGGGN